MGVAIVERGGGSASALTQLRRECWLGYSANSAAWAGPIGDYRGWGRSEWEVGYQITDPSNQRLSDRHGFYHLSVQNDTSFNVGHVRTKQAIDISTRTGECTFCCWIRRRSGINNVFIYGTSGNAYPIMTLFSSGEVQTCVWDSTGGAHCFSRSAANNAPLLDTDDTWHLLTFRYNLPNAQHRLDKSVWSNVGRTDGWGNDPAGDVFFGLITTQNGAQAEISDWLWFERQLSTGEVDYLYDLGPGGFFRRQRTFFYPIGSGVTPPTDIQGTASWHWHAQGDNEQLNDLVGTASWVWDATGDADVLVDLAGTASWTWDATAFVTADANMLGTSDWLWDTTGISDRIWPLDGVANWVWGATAFHNSTADRAGTTDWLWDTSGSLATGLFVGGVNFRRTNYAGEPAFFDIEGPDDVGTHSISAGPGADNPYPPGTEKTTDNGATVRYGWDSLPPVIEFDLESGHPPELAGMHGVDPNDGTPVFRIDIPSLGIYEIDAAFGSAGQNVFTGWELRDGDTTVIAQYTNALTGGVNIWRDATDVIRNGTTAWLNDRQTIQHEFQSFYMTLRHRSDAALGRHAVAHLSLTQITAPPPLFGFWNVPRGYIIGGGAR